MVGFLKFTKRTIKRSKVEIALHVCQLPPKRDSVGKVETYQSGVPDGGNLRLKIPRHALKY